MKTAILVASFGTTHLDTLQKTIGRTEEYISNAFPDIPVYRAFTSSFIRSKLNRDSGEVIDSVDDALLRIASDGFKRVVVQPTFLVPGSEYDKLCACVKKLSEFIDIIIGNPLLYRDSDLDYMVELIRSNYHIPHGTVLLMVGHGTEGCANDFYVRLAEKMRNCFGSSMRLCTLKGPPTYQDVIADIKTMPQRKILLAPMMLVAGDHVKNDLLGSSPDSLKSQLVKEGFAVDCLIRGLGEIAAIQQLYVERIMETNAIAVPEKHARI